MNVRGYRWIGLPTNKTTQPIGSCVKDLNTGLLTGQCSNGQTDLLANYGMQNKTANEPAAGSYAVLLCHTANKVNEGGSKWA